MVWLLLVVMAETCVIRLLDSCKLRSGRYMGGRGQPWPPASPRFPLVLLPWVMMLRVFSSLYQVDICIDGGEAPESINGDWCASLSSLWSWRASPTVRVWVVVFLSPLLVSKMEAFLFFMLWVFL